MQNEKAARSTFADRQSEMTAQWYENVKRRHGDVQAYIETRWDAYLDRWKEAARFIPSGSRVLDLGGGNQFPGLLDFIKSHGYVYHYRDVDRSCVEGSKTLALNAGLNPDHFQVGFNDDLDFPDASFDAIFSSHCIEHSFDLERTLRELNRVLAPSGVITIAVPFGWETNPEHPYFFSADEWLKLITSAGFRIRVAQFGREYPESGYDLFVCAQKESACPAIIPLNPEWYKKTNFETRSFQDTSVSYSGSHHSTAECMICIGGDWSIDIAVPHGAREVLPIFKRHDWSAIIETRWRGASVYEDLYSWFSYVQPVRIRQPASDISATEQIVRIRPVGRHLASQSSEGIFYGFMFN